LGRRPKPFFGAAPLGFSDRSDGFGAAPWAFRIDPMVLGLRPRLFRVLSIREPAGSRPLPAKGGSCLPPLHPLTSRLCGATPGAGALAFALTGRSLRHACLRRLRRPPTVGRGFWARRLRRFAQNTPPRHPPNWDPVVSSFGLEFWVFFGALPRPRQGFSTLHPEQGVSPARHWGASAPQTPQM
jgi:hypothetical protein